MNETVAAESQSALEVLLVHGGPVVWLIFLIAFVLLVVGTERLITLFLKLSFKTQSALDSIRTYILDKKYTEALQVCNSQAQSPDIAVVKAGLLAVENGREAMKSALSGAVLEVSHKCENRLPYLSLIANVATLLGLLGTITGLIKTFASIATADPAEKARMLGLGISEAMYATATGLSVGVLAMVVYTICTTKSDSIVGQAQDTGYKLITWIEQSERAASGGRAF